MSADDVVARRPWEAFRGPRQGLARRRELLLWMLDAPENQHLSGREIAARCPVYANWPAADPYPRVMKDLNNMAEIECTVVGSRNRPVEWSATALGADLARTAPRLEAAQ